MKIYIYENYIKIGIDYVKTGINYIKNYIELMLMSNNYLNDSDFLLLFFVIFTVDVAIMSYICRRNMSHPINMKLYVNYIELV